MIADSKNRVEPVVLLAIANCFYAAHAKDTMSYTSFHIAEGILRECDVFVQRWFIVLLHFFMRNIDKSFMPALHESGLAIADALGDMLHSCLTNTVPEFNHELFQISVREDPSGPAPVIKPEYYERTVILCVDMLADMAQHEHYWSFLSQARLTAMLTIVLTHSHVNISMFESILKYSTANKRFFANVEKVLESNQVLEEFLDLVDYATQLSAAKSAELKSDAEDEQPLIYKKIRLDHLPKMLQVLEGHASQMGEDSASLKRFIDFTYLLLSREMDNECHTIVCRTVETNILRFEQLACPSHQAVGSVVEFLQSEDSALKEAASNLLSRVRERWNMEHFEERIRSISGL